VAKFNIYDESSWSASATPTQKDIDNRAIGAIGNRIGEIYALKRKLENPSLNNEDYNIAEELRKFNKTAYDLMEISYKFPDAEVAKLLSITIQIENIWKNYEQKWLRWREVLPLIKEIEPYLRSYRNATIIDDAMKDLTKTQVLGNEAWAVYLSSVKRANMLSDSYTRVKDELDSIESKSDDSNKRYPKDDIDDDELDYWDNT
jgi:hypothetical protein